MIKTAFRLLPLAAAIGLATAALADTKQSQAPVDVYNLSLAELGQVQISIATGNSTPLDKAPATASVIYAAEIEAMGAKNLNDVLETVPGLHVSLSSLSRLDSIYSIRGIHTGFNPQVLLLLNGVPVQYSAQGNHPTLFRLPAVCIDRVEVIRGPGSAIYGADAYAGVINVITKGTAEIEYSSAGLREGSFDSHDYWLQGATQWHDIGFALSLAYQESSGDPERLVKSDLQSTLDAALGTHASLAPGSISSRYQVLDTHLAVTTQEMQANLWNWRATDMGVGVGAAQALDPGGRDDSDLWMADVTYHFATKGDWDNSARLSYMHYDEGAQFTILPAGTVLPIGSDGNLNFTSPAGIVAFPEGLKGNPGGLATDTQLDFISVYNGWSSHRLRMAVGGRRQTLDPSESKNFGPGVIDGTLPVVNGTLTDVSNTEYVFLPNSARRLSYVSLQDEWRLLSDLTLTSGLRYDHYSDFGSTTNPRIALVWGATEKLTTKLMYGRAFRAPAFSEQFTKNNPVSLGNPSLTPEKMDSLELSLNYRLSDNLQSTLTLFSYEARDMIEYTPDANATSKTARNARDQNGQGFEYELSWRPSSGLRISSSYSYQDATNDPSGTTIPDAPGKQFKLTANWEMSDKWSANGQAYWIGDRSRAPGDTRSDIKNYTLLNLTLKRKNLVPGLNASLAVRNLADADAHEPSSGTIPGDYPLESRSEWLEFVYTFQ